MTLAFENLKDSLIAGLTMEEYRLLRDRFGTYLAKQGYRNINGNISVLNRFLRNLIKQKAVFKTLTFKDIKAYREAAPSRNFASVYRFLIREKYVSMDSRNAYNREKRGRFADFTADYLKHKRMAGVRGESIVLYGKYLLDFERFLFQKDALSLKAINLDLLESYSFELLNERRNKTGRPLKRKTVSNVLMVIKDYFSFLAREEHLNYNPASLLKLPRAEQNITQNFFTLEEVGEFFKTMEEEEAQAAGVMKFLAHRNRMFFLLCYTCGLRIGEAAALRVKDVDFEKEVLHVKGKGGFGRTMPLTTSTTGRLKEYMKELKKRSTDPEECLFPTRRGKPLPCVYAQRALRYITNKAGIKHRPTVHVFRHSIGRHLLKAGLDIRYVQKFLGHRNINSTAIYTTLDVEELKKALRSFHPREQHQGEYLKQAVFTGN